MEGFPFLEVEEGVVVGAVGRLATSRTQPLNHHAVDDNCASPHRSYERPPRSALLISFALLLLSCPSYSARRHTAWDEVLAGNEG